MKASVTSEVSPESKQAESVQASSIVQGNAGFFGDDKERLTWYYDGSYLSKLSIDIYSVWDEYLGDGIKVGVIDTQINYSHPDLARAYDKDLDYNFALGSDDPLLNINDQTDTHGTFVAGLIAGEGGNEKGSVGIAQNATLVGYGVDYGKATALEDILAALDAAVSVDVVNNSWSFVASFDDKFNKNPELEAPLLRLVTEGRDGLGTVAVFAAGNDGDASSSNYHNFQNSPYTIAVGAVDSDGNAADFTSRGANVLLSAPGVDVYSTKVKNSYGYGDGTSFAAPIVSGAVALMLEANSELGYRDVQQILAYSSKREQLADDSGFGDGWQINGADNHNGGGLHFNDAFGFGLLNVHDAVRLAETWTAQNTFANMTTISTTIDPDLTLRAGVDDHLTVTFDISENISVENVQLSLNTMWKYVGDLDVYLSSPSGTQVRLVYDVVTNSHNINSLFDFDLGSVATMGEESQGTWQLDIINRKDAATITKKNKDTADLQEVTLTLHGSALNLADDNYIYTDEFTTIYSGADLAARSQLNDDDGGVDTLNASALTGIAIIDLSGNFASSLGGVVLTIAPLQIENAYAGDGNDTIYGSAADNVLLGGRGDDSLYFSLGSDMIDGGQGNDTLFVSQALSKLAITISADGTLLIADGTAAVSSITGVENFVFAGQSYTLSELASSEPAPDGDGDTDGGDTGGGDTGGDTGGGDTGGDTGSGDDTGAGTEDGTGDDTGGGSDGSGEPEEPDLDKFYTLFTGTDGKDSLNGTSGADRIEGGSGRDKLVGDEGDDLLYGGNGKDTLVGGNGDDRLYGEVGSDRLWGGNGTDYLSGGDESDTLGGGEGDDWLWGGKGADNLTGDDGADTFVFDISDIGSIDLITDFDASEGDKIVITGLQQSSSTNYAYVARGGDTYLELSIGNDVYELALLRNVDLASSGLDASNITLLYA